MEADETLSTTVLTIGLIFQGKRQACRHPISRANGHRGDKSAVTELTETALGNDADHDPQSVIFERFLSDLPLLHSWDGGITWNTGGFNAEQLRMLIGFLQEKLPARPLVLETGAGCSTIAFLFLRPARVVSVAPSRDLFARIREYCQQQGLATSVLDCHVGLSEWVLPRLAVSSEAPAWLDFALIDGGHGWPTPFLDFFYATHMLKQGGYIMVDDVQLHSVKELARLLAQQPGFELALDLRKSLLFRKTTEDRSLPDWTGQPYIVQRSEQIGRRPDPFALGNPAE